MKIIAELVRVRQDWDPDTNTHNNSVIFEFAGVQVEVPCTPEQVKSIIIESQRMNVTAYAAHPETPPRRVEQNAERLPAKTVDDVLSEETTDEEPEVDVFGGDYVQDPDEPVAAPVLFQGPAEASALETALAPPQRQTPPLSAVQQREALVASRRAQDPAKQRADQKAQMRQRARSMPQKKLTVDESGNPVVYVDRGAQIVGPAGRPEVQIHRTTAPVNMGGDDDRFHQG